MSSLQALMVHVREAQTCNDTWSFIKASGEGLFILENLDHDTIPHQILDIGTTLIDMIVCVCVQEMVNKISPIRYIFFVCFFMCVYRG